MHIKKISALLIFSTAASAMEGVTDWRYSLPSTGVMPSAFSYEVITRADARNGDGHLGVQNFNLTLPFSDPRKTGYKDWAFSFSLDSTISLVDHAGWNGILADEFYTFSLPTAVVKSYGGGRRLTMGVMPTLSSDFRHGAHAFTMGAFGSYSMRVSDNFSCTLGMAYSPRSTSSGILPLVGFEWKFAPQWSLNLRNAELALTREITQKFQTSLFIGAKSAAWIADTEQGARWLRTQSLVLGVQAEYDFSKGDEKKRIIYASIGSSIGARAELRDTDGRKSLIERKYYGSSLFFSAGLDFRF